MKSVSSNLQHHNSELFHSFALSANSLEKIDSICIRFETAWKSDAAPKLETYLKGFDGEIRSALLAELLLLEIDYRLRDGQTPDPMDYETRFPGESTVIESAFRVAQEPETVQHLGDRSDHLLPPAQLEFVSRIELRNFHAQGGLGVVYVADDHNLGRRVAVKIPKKKGVRSAEHIRLTREAEITGRLEHPGIVPVYARGCTDDGRPCYVMPLIDGHTLQHAIGEFHNSTNDRGTGNPFQSLVFRQLLQRLVAVCNAIAYAHEQNVIHRDIKPGNIMLGKFGETYLLDWGLAKRLDNTEVDSDKVNCLLESSHDPPQRIPLEHTKPGQQLGTPAFASPEQVTGDVASHDPRSDIYSLGATLYCLLTGQSPIRSSDLTSARSPTALQHVPRPRELKPAIPQALEAICLKAMAFRQQNRFENVMQMGRELERFLADEPVDVLPEPWIKQVGRWARKHPRLIAGIFASVIVAAISLGTGSLLLEKKNHQLMDSNQRLLESRATQQLAQTETLTALHAMTDGVVERWFAGKKDLSQEDQLFIESILESYQRFADLQSSDMDAMQAKAEGHFRVGQLKRFLDDKPGAIEAWQSGLDIISHSSATQSDDLRNLHSKLQASLGVLLVDLGESPRGFALVKSAVEQDEKLLIDNPDSFHFQRAAALRRFNLGNEYLRQANQLEAERQFKRSLELTKDLSAPSALESLRLNRLIAGSYFSLGSSLYYQNRFAESKQQLDHSLKLHRELAHQSSDTYYQLDVGRALGAAGRTNRRLKDFDQARTQYTESIAVLEKYSERYPSRSDPAFLISSNQQGLARIDFELRDYQGAFKHGLLAQESIDKAIESAPDELLYYNTSSTIQMLQGFICLKLKQPDQAEDFFREALDDADHVFNVDSQRSNRSNMIATIMELGRLRFEDHDFVETAELCVRALALIEGIADESARKSTFKMEVACHQLLGLSLMKSGRQGEAAKHWQKVIDLASQDPIMSQDENVVRSAKNSLADCAAIADPTESSKVNRDE